MLFDYKTQYHRYKHYFLKLHSVYEKPVAKTSLTLILTLLTISFFSLFAIKPTFITIAKLSKKLNDSRKTNKALEAKIKSLKQAQIAYQKVEQDLDLVERALPNKVNFNSFSSKINLLSYQNKLLLTSANFSKFNLLSVNFDAPTKLEFKISLAGNYLNIKNFLKELATLDRLVKITSVNFAKKSKIKNAQIQTNVNGVIFWLPALNQGVKND
jgi:Tfp pilus assembly protein PilO